MVVEVGRLRLLSGQQLRRLYFGSDSNDKRNARRILQALVQRRVLARLGRSVGGVRAGSEAYVYCLDVVGQWLIDPTVPPSRPWGLGYAFVRHALMVSDCYVSLREIERTGGMDVIDFDAEPACWRTFVNRRGVMETLKPDAFMKVGLGNFEDRWLVECDRATEDLGRIGRKLAVYLRYWQSGREEPFPRVLWVTTRPERAKALTGTIARLSASDRQLFDVCLNDRFVERVLSGAEESSLDGTPSHIEQTKGGDQ